MATMTPIAVKLVPALLRARGVAAGLKELTEALALGAVPGRRERGRWLLSEADLDAAERYFRGARRQGRVERGRGGAGATGSPFRAAQRQPFDGWSRREKRTGVPARCRATLRREPAEGNSGGSREAERNEGREACAEARCGARGGGDADVGPGAPVRRHRSVGGAARRAHGDAGGGAGRAQGRQARVGQGTTGDRADGERPHRPWRARAPRAPQRVQRKRASISSISRSDGTRSDERARLHARPVPAGRAGEGGHVVRAQRGDRSVVARSSVRFVPPCGRT